MRYVLLKICHHKWKLLQVTDKKYLSAETQAITNIHGQKGHYLEGGAGANGGRPCSNSPDPSLCEAHFMLTLLPLTNVSMSP